MIRIIQKNKRYLGSECWWQRKRIEITADAVQKNLFERNLIATNEFKDNMQEAVMIIKAAYLRENQIGIAQ